MRSFIALLVVSVVSVAFWASLDRPLDAPDWRGQIRGLSYTPSHLFTEQDWHEHITEALIRRDLEQLSKVTKRVRTYTVSDGQDRIPYIAKEYGLKVSLGIWLGDDLKKNDVEIQKALKVISDNPGVIDRIFVGNEAVGVRAELTVDQLSAYIREVKAAINNRHIQVGTAENWDLWIAHPELAKDADFVGVHVLPYWNGVTADQAINFITEKADAVQKRIPNKPVVIGETGWPSEGRVRRGS